MINKNNLFYATFTLLDQCLPRKVARLPYDFAYQQLREASHHSPHSVKVWTRNSVKQGNFVFGLSDLDISLLSSAETAKEFDPILRLLSHQKTLFPFLGETNFYHPEWCQLLKASANFFELSRDPDLFQMLAPSKDPVDDVVFLLRMLFSDRENLITRPDIRRRKWMKHFLDVGVVPPGDITFDSICTTIGAIAAEPRIASSLQMLREDLSEPGVYFMPKKHFWKYLYPHKHLWFETSEVDEPGEIRGTKLAKICLRQIDWEIWGLMTQLPYIPDLNMGFKVHLERLGKVASALGDESGINSRISYLLERSALF